MKKFTLTLIVVIFLSGINALFAQSRGYDFDGIDDNVWCATFSTSPSSQVNLTGAGTFEFWVNLDALPTTNARLISRSPNSGAIGWQDEIYIMGNDGRINTSNLVVGGDLISPSALPTGEWVHIAITADGSGSKMYINGLLVDEGGAADFSYDSFRFGGQYTGSFWEAINGRMDEVRVWSDVRTPTEIVDNMYGELSSPSTQTGLVAYYKLNETPLGSGAINAQGNTTNNGDNVWITASLAGAIPIYVDADASGDNDGGSWANAYTSLQSALDAAISGNEIWVAEGTYKPSSAYDLTNTSRYYHFRMINGVEIYGGFTGTETATSQRADYGSGGVNETILSGDIGTVDVNTDNCYHVFYHPSGLGLTSSSILDGFTVTKGYANGTSPHYYGGGMYNNTNSPTINNCIFKLNTASFSVFAKGGGMYNYSSSPSIKNCTFESNLVSGTAGYGGAISNNNSSSPSIVNTLFTGNSGTRGGATNNSSSGGVVFTNCTFINNSASDWGGAIYNESSNIQIKNSILWGNSATNSGNEMYNNSSTPTITYTDIEGGSSGTGNINSNPKFDGSGSYPYAIVGNSPCVDIGTNTGVTESYDIRGVGFARTQNTTTDMGAYEYTSGTDPAVATIFVDVDASGSGIGSNWGNSFSSASGLQSALDIASSGDQIWVAKGTYKPSTMVGGATDRDKAFQMVNGVEIYGGFAGTETATSQRTDFGLGGANQTILSGDIDGSGDNDCYHVFYHQKTDGNINNSSKLDGFIIKDGKGATVAGGFYEDNYSNKTRDYTIENCTFTNNSSTTNGGAVYMYQAAASFLNCTFSNCSSMSGSGIAISRSPASFINCTFTDNTATPSGGGGAIYVMNTSATPAFTNCLIINNTATAGTTPGGGIFLSNGSAIFTNVTVANNSASYYGGGIYAKTSSLCTIKNSIIWGNTGFAGNNIYNSGSTITMSYSDVDEDGYTGNNNNIRLDPLFADFGNDDYRIAGSSPCVNVGDNDANSETYDIRGETRIQNTTIDIGAYEYTSGTDPVAGAIAWTAGASTTVWETPGNWDADVVPTANYNITIPNLANDPIIGPTQTADCNNLTVESSATLTIESTSSGTGSLIVKGTATGDVTAERFIEKGTWHYISAPVNDTRKFNTFLELTAGTGTDIDQFYWWDEDGTFDGSTGIWFDILNGSTGVTYTGGSFISSQGYAINYKSTGNNKTLSFSGVPYTETQSIIISKTDVSTGVGSNLVGNPFCSTIAINDDADATNNFLDQNSTALHDSYEAIYVWDEAVDWSGGNADYDTYSNAGDVAIFASPGQAFMVQAASDGATINFNTSTRKHGSATYYKNINQDDASRFYMSVENEEGLYNEILIAFIDNMTNGLDKSYDAGKMKGNPDIALYTKLVDDIGTDFAHQALPLLEDKALAVVTGLDVSTAGNYTFKIKELQNFDESIPIKLEDKLTGSIIDLRQAGEYSFFINTPGQIRERFVLHFNGVTGIDNDAQTTEPTIQTWASHNIINIFNKHNLNGEVKVVNMYGHTIVNTKLTGDASQQIMVNSPSGYYIVNIVTNNQIINKKVYLK